MKDKRGLLTMCMKAERMVLGMDMMKDACGSGNAFGVFTADDLSEKSLKEVRFHCGRGGVKLWALGMTMDEIGTALGKRSGIIAVTDKGFAEGLAKGLAEIEVL